MKAIVYTEYGSPDVLRLEEVEKPTPKDNEILIRVHATTVNFGDLMARNFRAVTPEKFSMPLLFWIFAKMSFGLSKPKVTILGSEFAGDVEATGKDVRRFKKGDQVFGYPGMNMGAYAEYLCMPESGTVALKPANMTYDEAAAVPYGAVMGVSLCQQLNIQPGQEILIIGASGGIGSAVLQLAKYYGAKVTGVCGTQRVAYVKSLGADKVIDYTKEDFTQSGDTYDLIIDILGKGSFSRSKKALNENGRYIFISYKMKQVIEMLWTSITGGKKVLCMMLSEKTENLTLVKELVEASKYKTIVEKSFAIEKAAEAHRYVEEGLKKGNVVINMGGRL